MDHSEKKQKNVEPSSPNRSEEGDAWTYTCIKRHTYFFAAFSVGKWTHKTCRQLIGQLFDRTQLPSPDNKMEIFTDGNRDYIHTIPEYYATNCVDYGQLIKIRENGRVVDKQKRTIYGNPNHKDIETTDVENSNGILRERIGRLVRKTKCFSKTKQRFESALHLFQFYWNFINNFKRNTTPAMLEGLADHPWTWNDFLMHHYAV